MNIKQYVDLAEIFLNWDTKNKYRIYDNSGTDMFLAEEDSGCCARMCLGAQRGFVMPIQDEVGNETFRLNRPLKCTGCCCPCNLQMIEA